MKKQKTFLQRFSFFFFFSCLPLVIFSLLKQNMSPLSPPLFFSLLKTSRSKPQRPNAGRGSVQKKGSVSKKKNLACFLFVFPFFFFFFFLARTCKIEISASSLFLLQDVAAHVSLHLHLLNQSERERSERERERERGDPKG